MSELDMLNTAEAEVLRLEAEIAKTPLGQKLALARQVVSVYKANPTYKQTGTAIDLIMAAADAANTVVQRMHKTKTELVEAACVAYLRKTHKRASSGVLWEEAVRPAGINIPGAVPAKSLSAYLSNSPLFDNVREEGGYGLQEWSQSARQDETATTP